jgi:hypothetical protein
VNGCNRKLWPYCFVQRLWLATICFRKYGFFDFESRDEICADCVEAKNKIERQRLIAQEEADMNREAALQRERMRLARVKNARVPDIGVIKPCRGCGNDDFYLTLAKVGARGSEPDNGQQMYLEFNRQAVYSLVCTGCGIVDLRCNQTRPVVEDPLTEMYRVRATSSGPYR